MFRSSISFTCKQHFFVYIIYFNQFFSLNFFFSFHFFHFSRLKRANALTPKSVSRNSRTNMDAFNFSSVIPPWLDQDMFERAFRSHDNDPTVQVISFDIQAATQPGENMASAVFRAKVKISSKKSSERELSVIVKTKPFVDIGPGMPEELRQQMDLFHNSNLFDTEMAMFASVLPQVESLLKAAGECDVIWPK
jgi:hypothetical protein